MAYSLDEILFELGSTGVFYEREEMQMALDELIAMERVESAEANGELYYRCIRSLGFRPPRR